MTSFVKEDQENDELKDSKRDDDEKTPLAVTSEPKSSSSRSSLSPLPPLNKPKLSLQYTDSSLNESPRSKAESDELDDLYDFDSSTMTTPSKQKPRSIPLAPKSPTSPKSNQHSPKSPTGGSAHEGSSHDAAVVSSNTPAVFWNGSPRSPVKPAATKSQIQPTILKEISTQYFENIDFQQIMNSLDDPDFHVSSYV